MDLYRAERDALLASAVPGTDAARRLSSLTDEAVRDLARAASPVSGSRFALVACGGWGSGALLPSSDLDLLVLSEAPADRLEPFVRHVLYPLWDAGLSVGHQVRTARGQLQAAREELANCTATLTARPLAGDRDWAAGVLAACAADARKRSKGVLAALANRPRPGSPYYLEPDLKVGAGGRRDYDELTWTAAVLSGCTQRDPAPLVKLGILTAPEYAILSGAAETIAATRWELALSGAGDQLTLDALDALSPGLADAAQVALAETARMLMRARCRIAGEGDKSTAPLTAAQAFELLDSGDPSLPILERAAQESQLEGLIPGFRALMTLRRPGLGHELTVGAHSLRTATRVADAPGEGVLVASAAVLEDRRALQVAAIAHDVGKSAPGADHPERGAAPAVEIARRFGLDEQRAAHVGDLVRLHLALPEMAMRIDLDDEDAVLSAAARIGRRELLAPLHLLTAADSMATGPSMWSEWTAALVGKLVARIDAAFSDEVDGAGIVARGESVRTAALAALFAAPETECSFVRAAPLRYLASHTPAEVARDAALAAELTAAGGTGARVAVSAGPTPGTHAVTVVAFDRPELLARIAGALALAGLDILAVDAYGVTGHVAVDTFVVTSATRRPVTTEDFTLFERFLTAALGDRLELKTRLTERRRHYPALARGPVEVTTASAGYDTTVRISAPDRPGLLHDLAQAVAATGLNIRWAKVVTIDGMALDTFHVVDVDELPVHDHGLLGHLAMRMREVC